MDIRITSEGYGEIKEYHGRYFINFDLTLKPEIKPGSNYDKSLEPTEVSHYVEIPFELYKKLKSKLTSSEDRINLQGSLEGLISNSAIIKT